MSGQREVRVWDPFVRLFHWGVVAGVAVTSLSSDHKWLHEPVGYAVLVLTVLRIVWGFVGTRHARFSDFVAGPGRVRAYLAALFSGRAERHLGHNPAGGAMVVLLLILLLVAGVSGWMTETNRWFGVPWVDHLHHRSAHLLILLAGFHLVGVIVSSRLHGENLVRAMLTGRKPGLMPEQGD